jgi:hypothetical protein
MIVESQTALTLQANAGHNCQSAIQGLAMFSASSLQTIFGYRDAVLAVSEARVAENRGIPDLPPRYPA